MMSGSDMALVKAIAKKSATSSCYHPAGSKTCAELLPALLVPENVGSSYLMSDSGTTTEYFIEGAGKTIDQNDTVVVCNFGTVENPIIKFDLRQNFIDLSNYVEKEQGKGLSENDFTDADKSNLDDNTSARHTHSNDDVLDDITAAYTTEEATKLNGISNGATKTEASQTNGNVKIDNVETNVYTHPGSGTNPHGTTKGDVGLGNVDNTSDADKPVSTATQTALNGKVDKSSVGEHSGIAELDENGLVPVSQLPSYVDDVLDGTAQNVTETAAGTYSATAFILAGQQSPCTPESGKTYVDTTTNIQYRWSGSVYVSMGTNLTLGENSNNAFSGDKGKTAYDHSQATGNPHGTTKADLGLGNVDNTSDLNKPISNAVKAKLIETAESMKSLWDLSDYEGETVNCSIGLPSDSYVPSQEYWGQKFLNVEDGGIWDVVKMHPSEEYAFMKTGQVNLISANYNKTPILGIHINDAEENPDKKITYIADAVGMTPAHMDYTNNIFDYGSFANMWFVKDCKPCIFHHSGYVMKYLDPSDFTTDIDGNTVAIDGGLTDAEIMIEHPKTWIKFSPDPTNDASADVFFSPVKIDADFKDFPYINYQGVHKEKFYMPAYMGSLIDGHMRSLSGQQVKNRLTATDERAYCKANGNGWDLVQSSMFMHIDMLLLLMGRTTDIKKAFGQGLHTGGTEAINNNFRTGVHNDKGMFYGTNSGTIADGSYGNAVKIFGTEHYYGFAWIRKLGDMLINGVRRIKMCYGNEDGSSTYDYNLTGDGYVNVGAAPSGTSGGFISKMKFTILGMFAKVASGTETTHYKAGYWFNTSETRMAFRGGASADGSRVSPFSLGLYYGPAYAYWYFASAPSYI